MEKTKKHLTRLPSKETMDKLESTDIIIEMDLLKYQQAISHTHKQTLEEVEKIINEIQEVHKDCKTISYGLGYFESLEDLKHKLKQLEKKER